MTLPEQFRDPLLETSGEIIGFYPREFFMLDNFSSFRVDYLDRTWATSEHAYHAAKFFETAPDVFEQIYQARSAHDALKIATEHKALRAENWDEIKVDKMEEICTLKAQQNPYVLSKLLLTGDMVIVEDSPKDSFWGWGEDRQGRNELGKIWMRLRDKFRSGELSASQYNLLEIPTAQLEVPKVGVGVIIENEDGDILFGKRIGSHAPYWSIPGGKLDPGEAFEDGGRREVEEEHGIIIDDPKVISVTNNLETFRDEGLHFISVILLAKTFKGQPKVMEPNKCKEIMWADPRHLPQPHFEASRFAIKNYLEGVFYSQSLD